MDLAQKKMLIGMLIAGTVSGGDPLSALQTAAVTSGLPFCLVLLIMCYTLYKALGEETLPAPARRRDKPVQPTASGK